MTEKYENFQPGRYRGVIILVAAGQGVRAGGAVPKQYQPVGGKPLIHFTLKNLTQAAPDFAILPVIAQGADQLYRQAASGFKSLEPITGGDTRQESVLNGLKHLAKNPPDIVLVHDAARPFVHAGIVESLADALDQGYHGVLPALPVADTLKRSKDGKTVVDTVDRQQLYRAQTPQAFQFKSLLKAHLASHVEATDDIQLLEHQGALTAMVPGDEELFKVTTAEDLARVEEKLMHHHPDSRTASGYDVHAFGPGDHVTLGGVVIPHDKGLDGHSDADVVLHAVTDAVLGAIAAGDIGDHFPPSDARFKDMDSAVFLTKARDLVAEKGGLIAHISVVIKAERPKIGPHKAAMRHRIAEILSIDVDRVSVQATTTEKLGFIGREEGIAALATATVRLPFTA